MRSLYTVFCRVMNKLWLRWALRWKRWRNIYRLHIFMSVSLFYMYRNSLTLKNTLCGPWIWNNNSKYRCQLILFWAKLNQFTNHSRIVCLGLTLILPSYLRFYRGNSDAINNGKNLIRFVLFPDTKLNIQLHIISLITCLEESYRVWSVPCVGSRNHDPESNRNATN